jgi:hypothetical protein
VDPARVQELLKQISSDDFETREAATEALIECGEAAWPLVLPEMTTEDADRRARLLGVAKQIGTFISEEEFALAEKFKAQLESTDENQRAAGLDGLVSMGDAGMWALQRHVSGKGAKPVLSLEVDQKVLLEGEQVTAKAWLKNEGDAALWLNTNPVRVNSYGPQPFGEVRPRRIFGSRGSGGRRVMVRRGGYYNPIRAWRALLKTSEAETATLDQVKSQYGVYRVAAQAMLPDPQKIQPRLHAPKENPDDKTPGRIDGEDTSTFNLEMAAAWDNAEARLLRAEKTFVVLPALPRKSEDERMRLSVVREDSADAGVLSVKATFTSLTKTEVQSLEKPLARYAWYVLLNAEKVPVAWGSWESVKREVKESAEEGLAEEAPKIARRHELAPGEKAEWNLAIKLPEDAGEYALLIGYEKIELNGIGILEEELEDEEEILGEPKDGKTVVRYAGRLFAELNGIVVKKK